MLKFVKHFNILLRNPFNTQQQQLRTTFILKRQWEVPLHKTKQKPKKLRGRHFIYELITDTGVIKKNEIEVVLKTYVEGVGDKGDVVSLKPHLAYNTLLLPGLAVYKTPENIEKFAKAQEERVEELHSSPFAQRTVNMLEYITLDVVMNKDEKWVIEPWHIKASLRKAGYICNESCITLPKQPIEGPDLNKENKEFYCTITINNLEKARLKCRIHHWSTDPSERLPFVFEYWKMPSEPLFNDSEDMARVDPSKADV